MKYANSKEVRTLCKYTGDEVDDDLLNLACDNADTIIISRLSENRIPKPLGVPLVLKTAANYYAVSDILQSLYHGEERSGNEKAYYDKAEARLNTYINEQLDELKHTTLKDKLPYSCSKSPSPYELGIIRR